MCSWFLEIAFVRKVSISVCKHVRACVSATKAINYIHMILNLYIKVSKFAE